MQVNRTRTRSPLPLARALFPLLIAYLCQMYAQYCNPVARDTVKYAMCMCESSIIRTATVGAQLLRIDSSAILFRASRK